MIDVLVPVLGRPQNARRTSYSLRRSSTLECELTFVCSPGDDEEIEACKQTGENVLVVDWAPGPGDYARKINFAYRCTSQPWVFTGADDLCFCPGWDREAMLVAATGKSVIGTDDLWNPAVRKGNHSTHTLVRRAYIDQVGGGWDGPGVLLHEGYDHQYVDNELVAAARARVEWAFAAGSKVEHLHPMAGKSDDDHTYVKALRGGRADARLFQERSRWGK